MDGPVTEPEEAIISIRPRFADAIMAGSKSIELRRRIPAMLPGMLLWIYSTKPVGAVVGSAVVERVIKGSPDELWSGVGADAGISREEFDAYFDGAKEAVGLILTDVKEVAPISIDQLRSMRMGFHPPQVISKLSAQEATCLRQFADAECA